MNIQLKQRLVGAVVLVSLGVIFIPMILPGDGDLSAPVLGDKVPPAPEYRFSPLPEPPAAAVLAEAAPVVEAPAQEPAVETSIEALAAEALPSPPPAAIKQDKQIKAWVVQVGSFSSDGNANALRDKLRKQGFACFVEAVKNEKSSMSYRVRLGPELTREKAEQLQQRVAAATKLNGMVLSYP